ncbi:MAG: hypothetical protein KIS86_02615 [Devosia sp.]|nr:hypothetical protein [Devosia sp.]
MSLWSHIELSGGRVSSASEEASEGVRELISQVGRFRFFIEAIDVEGGRLGLDSCADYEAALRRAELARQDFGIDHPVRDNIAGSY